VSTLRVTELAPFGVEVDVDLSTALEPDAIEQLRDLLWRRHLVRFRDQDITFAQQIELLARFGPVNRSGVESVDAPLTPGDLVSIDPTVGIIGAGRLAFHSDLSCCRLPITVLSLYGLDLEDDQTSTLFVDATDAYRDLPDDLRDRLAGLEVLNVYPAGGYFESKRSTSPGGRPLDLRLAHAVHPLVMPHPQNGDPILFANEHETDHVVGMTEPDSEELLQLIFEHVYRPANILEHRWRRGDLVVWDNFAVQHARADQAGVTTRTLRRVVCGEQGFYEQNPQMRVEAGAAGRAAGRPVLE
jgi:taurine dioxygenase